MNYVKKNCIPMSHRQQQQRLLGCVLGNEISNVEAPIAVGLGDHSVFGDDAIDERVRRDIKGRIPHLNALRCYPGAIHMCQLISWSLLIVFLKKCTNPL